MQGGTDMELCERLFTAHGRATSGVLMCHAAPQLLQPDHVAVRRCARLIVSLGRLQATQGAASSEGKGLVHDEGSSVTAAAMKRTCAAATCSDAGVLRSQWQGTAICSASL